MIDRYITGLDKMEELLSSKRYEPPIINLKNQNSSHTLIIESTGFNKSVLEIGTSTGYISKILRERGNKVTGIEIDREAGLQAQQYCDRMIMGDVETLDLDKILTSSSFDVIVCGDVLEHLIDPTTLLIKLRKLLKPDGYLVVSLPNFCHGDVLLNLINGDFHYTSIGLLDKTHLRFFGLKNIYSIFTETGYQIKDIRSTNYDIGTTEQKVEDTKIPRDLLKFIQTLPDSTVYQYIFRAVPSDNVIQPNLVQDIPTFFFNSVQEFERELKASLVVEIEELRRNYDAITAQRDERDNQIAELKSYSTLLQTHISDRENQIAEIKKYSASLQMDISDRENQIAEVIHYARHLEQEISIKNHQIIEMENHFSKVTPYARHLEQEISAKNRHIMEITNQNEILNLENNLLKESISYQLTRKFHYGIIERFFPQNSRRRTYFDRGIKLGRIVINNGWREGIRSVKKYQTDKIQPIINIENQAELQSHAINEGKELSANPLITKIDENLCIFLSSTNNRLVFPQYAEPKVSIIILTYNKSSYTYQCLQSILKNSDVPYEVILVDNGSVDNTSDLLDRIDHCILIKSKINLGFIKGCNEGAKKASGDYLLFLNNDTIVTEFWLSSLVKTIETYPQCGAVGCKLVWPNGRLQEAGSIIWSDGSALGYGRGDDPEKSEYSYVREIDFCSGACLLVRTDIFRELNGFDIRYIPAYYEDSDLCLGIQNLGYKVIYQPKVTIFHHEYTSSSKEHAINQMIKNQMIFIKKWQEYLKTKKDNLPDTLLDARDSRKGKKVLVIDDRIPASHQGSGYPRANALLKNLGELGYKVTFFPIANKTPWQPYTSQFQSQGIEVLFGDHLDFTKFSQERSNFYDTIIVSRPHNFERTLKTIKTYFPNAYLIYDAEALFSTREILKAETEGKPLDNSQIKDLRSNEIELMKKADLIITVSENEKEIIQKNGDIKNIIIFGHPVEVKKTIAGFTSRKDILFVGSFLAPNGPNDDAIIFFVKEIWPSIQERLDCKLYIVGINPSDNVQRLASESIIVTGFVQNIEDYYDQCRVFVVPHRYAAGIPLKLIEAMSKGIPSVVSEIIASQLKLGDGKEVLIAKNSNEFAEKIIRVYLDESLWKRVQQNSLEHVQKNNNPETIKKYLKNAMIMSGKK